MYIYIYVDMRSHAHNKASIKEDKDKGAFKAAAKKGGLSEVLAQGTLQVDKTFGLSPILHQVMLFISVCQKFSGIKAQTAKVCW